MNTYPICMQPDLLIEYLAYQKNCYLFLDIDGTLSGFKINPKDSIVLYSTLSILQELQNHGIVIAIVTGCSLTEARELLSPIELPIAATHGLEIALNSSFSKFEDEVLNDVNTLSINTLELDKIKQDILYSCAVYDDFFVESKPYSVDYTLQEKIHFG
ncbi:trehalose-phosphatase [Psychrobacter vallis]|uniref:trehalose-phosphatase n=1 Tax=Psychrobacter vallis TaxID=248451 RepID=UPI001917E29D|nr:trehalose-phosphatase [Psychrobacter vallis]